MRVRITQIDEQLPPEEKIAPAGNGVPQRHVILFTDYRPQAVPGPFMVQWRDGRPLKQHCRGFDTYAEALEFAHSKVLPTRDDIPKWLRVEDADELDTPVQALMRLPAHERERRLSELPAADVAALRNQIEMQAARR